MTACIPVAKMQRLNWPCAPEVGMMEPKIVQCPACKGPSVYATGNPYRPFCSERCKSLDFGAWASEAFRVPTPPASEDTLGNDPTLQ